MNFQHDARLWARFPQLCAGAVWARNIRPVAGSAAALNPWFEQASERMDKAGGSEGQLPAIQAWRRVFAELGYKPTQYRCAAESLLRRLRQQGDLPRIHPLVDLLNALSVAHALPIAVFDLAGVQGDLTVRLATGRERFTSFSGDDAPPEPGEVVFVDSADHAHARRWCHRQSARSAVQANTTQVLIVVEAMHAHAQHDVQTAMAAMVQHLTHGCHAETGHAELSANQPVFSVPLPTL